MVARNTCPINFLGLNMFYRWLVEHEQPPDWGDGPEAYVTLFLTPLLRSQTDPAKPMSYDAHNALMRTPVFASAAWARVEAAVAAAENRELAHTVDAPVGSGALTRQIQNAMAPELKGLSS